MFGLKLLLCAKFGQKNVSIVKLTINGKLMSENVLRYVL